MPREPLIAQDAIRLKRCRYGSMVYLATDRCIGRSLDRYGEFTQGEMDLLHDFVARGSFVLDIGANVGTHTLFLARRVGARGLVLAFEPQRVIFQILCGNVALNALQNVHTHHAAVGREAAVLRVPALDYAASGNFGGLSLPGWSEGESVPVVTIDDLELPRCHLMKVDVEGMEREVVAGAERTIRRFRPVLYIENDRPEQSAALIDLLLGMDYRLYWHVTPLFNPDNYFLESEDILEQMVTVNMLGLHKSSKRKAPGLPVVRSEARA